MSEHAAGDAFELERDEVVVIETNLDNVTGELLGWLMERLMAAGALDVSYTAMQMKKNRPGTLARVIARPEDAERLAALVVRETPTLGVRLMPMQRLIAARRQETLASPYGPVTVKLKLLAGTVVSAAPEYDDCRRLAEAHSIPLGEMTERLERWLREHYPDLAASDPAEENEAVRHHSRLNMPENGRKKEASMQLIRVTTRVRDQEEALRYYTEQLGFVKRADLPIPGMRWLTVAPSEESAVEIVLQPADWFQGEERQRHLALVGKDPTVVFQVADCQATYETLSGRGVEFSQPPTNKGYGIEAVAQDLNGNSLVFLQL